MTVSRGFLGHHDPRAVDLPPGQHLTRGFPVLTAGPTQTVATEDWSFTITPESGAPTRWTWDEMMALPSEDVTVDIHCVTRWTKLGTKWRGVPLDAFFEDVETYYEYAMVHSYGGYTTNLPLEDLLDGKAWVAYEHDGDPLHVEHGGPARLLVPHLYFWKSAKWVNGITMQRFDEPGFWEGFGYHNYGDPWREERHAGD
ncbi:Oxidoreductase molybdopterin binding domain-containing protein [Nocardioides terrae]|uniref:Oxidoreductase molybdopterin binding domain-containing protein n=1 Tax=Nocardioides terrae TaxID=574651 RepID=A0A1I1P3U5_9ACTN|nr:sulfite oxidase-like oxidoreductase [Nocardioides terrae]SFD00620.1 Oxidoreductase molybdopterin binding domain-containing protein [Nocardioides terrae]